MFQAIRKHLTPGTFIAFLALVFAITGGAFAAGGHGGGSGKTTVRVGFRSPLAGAVKSKAKGKAGTRGPAGPKGATGAPGAAGSAGPAGPTGATGPAGAQGPQGPAGANGTNGEPGASVTSRTLGINQGGCPTGGTEFTAANGTSKACNGKEGSPYTAGGTLPSGSTETGAWSVIYTATAAGQPGSSAISFTIPLKAEPATHYINNNGMEPFYNETTEKEEERSPSAACAGGSASSPKAETGTLCVFATQEANAGEFLFHGQFRVGDIFGASADGAAAVFDSENAGEVSAVGTWAVTG